MESITLYYKEGASDKIYQANLEAKDDGFIVTFAYGRRGSTLNTGAKTSNPVPYESAKKIFDKLIKDKTAKGYTPGEDGTPYQHTDKADEASGVHCQLLNPIEETHIPRYLND
ncbi:MAG: WGR domain-containing protein, partial [Chthoniobacterales bacterium]